VADGKSLKLTLKVNTKELERAASAIDNAFKKASEAGVSYLSTTTKYINNLLSRVDALKKQTDAMFEKSPKGGFWVKAISDVKKVQQEVDALRQRTNLWYQTFDRNENIKALKNDLEEVQFILTTDQTNIFKLYGQDVDVLNNRLKILSNKAERLFKGFQSDKNWSLGLKDLDQYTQLTENSFRELEGQIRNTEHALRGFSSLNIFASHQRTLARYKYEVLQLNKTYNELKVSLTRKLQSTNLEEARLAAKQLDLAFNNLATKTLTEVTRATNHLRIDLLDLSRVMAQPLDRNEFQYLYKSIRETTLGAKKFQEQLDLLRVNGRLPEELEAVYQRLTKIVSQSKNIERLSVAAYKVNTAFRNIRNGLKAVQNAAENMVNIVARTVYKVNFLMTQMGQQLHTLALYVYTAFASYVGVKAVDELEKVDITLQRLSASSETYAQNWQNIIDVAQGTPQTITQVADAFVRLTAYGLEPTNELMVTLQDTVAALGGDERMMTSIVRAFGQIQAKGKLMSQELRQLADANIPVYDILREKLGLTKDQIDEVGKAGISAQEAINAMVEYLGERFGGTAEARMNTLSGRLSNLGDIAVLTLQKVLKASGVWDYFKNIVKSLTDKIRELVQNEGALNEFASKVGYAFFSITLAIRGAYQELKEWFKTSAVIAPVRKLFDELANSSMSLSEILQNLIVFIVKMKIALLAFMSVGVVAGVFSAIASTLLQMLKAFQLAYRFFAAGEMASAVEKSALSFGRLKTTIISTFAAIRGIVTLTNPFGAIVTAFGLLAHGVYKHWKTFSKFLKEMSTETSRTSVVWSSFVFLLKTTGKVIHSILLILAGGFVYLTIAVIGTTNALWSLLSFDFAEAKRQLKEMTIALQNVTNDTIQQVKDVWVGVDKVTVEQEKAFRDTINSLKGIFVDFKDTNAVINIFSDAEKAKSVANIDSIIERLKALKLLVEDEKTGQLKFDSNNELYDKFVQLINKGETFNSIILKLENYLYFTSLGMQNLANDTLGVSDSVDNVEVSLDDLKKKYDEIVSESGKANKLISDNFEFNTLNINQAFEKLNAVLVTTVNRLREAGSGAENFQSKFLEAVKNTANSKLSILNNTLSTLKQKISDAKSELSDITKKTDEFNDKAETLKKSIAGILVDKSPQFQQDYIYQLEKNVSNAERNVRELKEEIATIDQAFASGLINYNQYNAEMTRLNEELLDFYDKLYKAYQEYDNSVKNDTTGKFAETATYKYEDLYDSVDKVQKKQKELYEYTKEQKENAISKMEKEAKSLEDKINDIKNLISQLNDIELKATIDDTEITKFAKYIEGLDGKVIEITAKIKQVQSTEAGFKSGGLVRKFATGGFLGGYGGGDRIRALLEAGEFVVRKEAVKTFGVDFFKALNSLQLPSVPVNLNYNNFNVDDSNVRKFVIKIGDAEVPGITTEDVLIEFENKMRRSSLVV